MSVIQAKVTTKGQVTLPKAIRQRLAIHAGDHIEFAVDAANQVCLRRIQSPGASAGCARPFLKPGQARLTREQEKAAMMEKIGEKYGSRQVR